jgi:transmembrane sensor
MTVPPLSNEPPDWDAIARHHAGESVGDEARRVAAWLDANPADAAMLAALDAIVATRAGALSAAEPDVEAALRNVRARMHAADAARVIPFPGPGAATGRPSPVRRWITGGIAAAAAVTALAVGLARRPTDPAAAGTPRGAAGSVIVTAVGVRDSVRLADGTRVILGPSSRLAVSPGYDHGAREVTLDGQAWLSVRHDAAQPFTVHAGNAVVRDVGTEFTVVTSGAGTSAVSVAVAQGSVELRGASAASAPVTLTAGDRAEVGADGRISAERGRASDEDLSWTRGRLVFRETRMDRVRDDVRRWYGVELRLADSSLLARRITASFDGEPVDRVLQVIALALGGEVERHDSVAVLRGPAR